jgi:hypothetical protein
VRGSMGERIGANEGPAPHLCACPTPLGGKSRGKSHESVLPNLGEWEEGREVRGERRCDGPTQFHAPSRPQSLFGGWIFSRDTAGDVHERGPNEPCSGATGRVQNPFCTRSAKSQAIDSPPNRFSCSYLRTSGHGYGSAPAETQAGRSFGSLFHHRQPLSSCFPTRLQADEIDSG